MRELFLCWKYEFLFECLTFCFFCLRLDNMFNIQSFFINKICHFKKTKSYAFFMHSFSILFYPFILITHFIQPKTVVYWHQLNNEGDILTPEDPSPHPVAHHTKPRLSSQYVLFQWLSWSLINGFNLKQRPWGVCVCVCVYPSIAPFLISFITL